MRRIESQIDTNAADYKANYAAMSERLKEFHARQHAARFERPQRDIDRLARQNVGRGDGRASGRGHRPYGTFSEASRL